MLPLNPSEWNGLQAKITPGAGDTLPLNPNVICHLRVKITPKGVEGEGGITAIRHRTPPRALALTALIH